MKGFYARAVIFCLATVASVYSVSSVKFTGMAAPNDYVAAIGDKHLYAGQLTGKRVLLCGGSSWAFGVDSERLEKEIGIPVANMGLHAALGLDFMLNEAADIMREGDAIVLSVEYFLDRGDLRLQKHAASFYPQARRYFSPSPLEEMDFIFNDVFLGFQNNFNFMLALGKQPENTGLAVYSRKAFNKRGDVTTHLENPDRLVLGANPTKFEYRYYEGIEKINAFCGKAAAKGAKVYFTFPAFVREEYEASKPVMEKYAEDLSKNIKAEILGTPEDFLFPAADFFDTSYHLNAGRRQKRTSVLIGLLKGKIVVTAAIESEFK